MPLKIAAKIDKRRPRILRNGDQTLMSDPNVEFIGEIGENEKDDFLGNAYAYLFPIDWPEPFGLTMIEAMACGTRPSHSIAAPSRGHARRTDRISLSRTWTRPLPPSQKCFHRAHRVPQCF